MLRSLRIRQLVLIDDLSLVFGPGLNVLTGETGAGKSILVDAVGLAVGDRADRSLIRKGADRAIVEAEFDLAAGSAAAGWARERGFEEWLEEGALIVRREIPVEGNARVQLNGSPASRTLLAEVGPLLLELHGQHEFRNLLSPERHLDLLDLYGEHGESRLAVAGAHRAWRESIDRRVSLRAAAADRQARLDRLDEEIREIEGLAPEPHELERLARERRVLRHAAEISEHLSTLIELTHDGETNAATLAHRAGRHAEDLARLDPSLEELAGRLTAAALELQDLGEAIRDYRDRTDFDPDRLETIERRRAELERLLLKVGCEEAELAGHLERSRAERVQIADLDGALREADEEVERAALGYVKVARELGRRRSKSASGLVRAVERQFKFLALEKARLEVLFGPSSRETVCDDKGAELPVGPRGAERAEFQLAANPGEPFRPLSRVASGGELSRVMLAIHVASERNGRQRTLVFDEIDAGVGGAVADAVGQRLARVAGRHQVLCVTHLPQVAAYADRHYIVRKSTQGKRTRTGVDQLDADSRVVELARMLGGRKATATSRQHAEELLRSAERDACASS